MKSRILRKEIYLLTEGEGVSLAGGIRLGKGNFIFGLSGNGEKMNIRTENHGNGQMHS